MFLEEIDFNKDFPSTRYYGSKRKHLDWIYTHVKEIDFENVLDVFGGSASVSLLFSLMGKAVTYNDCFKFNAVSADAVLNENSYFDIKKSMLYVDKIEESDGFVTKNFDGIYFNKEENMFLDGFVDLMSEVEGRERCILYYSIIQSCLSKRPFNLFHRANLSLRNNDAERSFGNLVTWNKPFKQAMKEFIWELYSIKSKSESNILCYDAMELPSNYDLVYLDPPYVAKERATESYSTRYHFLEGIVSPELWAERIDYKTKTKKFKSDVFNSEWFHKSKAKDLMFDLIDKHSSSTLVLSYGDDAVPSIEEILDFMKCKFDKVELHYKFHKHALSKRDRNEAIFIGRPK